MKTARRLTCIVTILLCLSPQPYMAQVASECEQVSAKIQELEKLNLEEMSPSMRQFHKEALLKRYVQFSKCLDREIQTTTETQKAVANAEAAAQVEQHLRKLTKTKSDVAGKITILRTLLDLTSEIADVDTGGPTLTDKRSTVNAERRATDRETAASTKVSMNPRAPAGDRATASNENLSVVSAAPTAANGVTDVSTRASAGLPAPVAPVQACGPSADYDAPTLLNGLAKGLAVDIIRNNAPDIAAQAGPQIVLYTVFDAASLRSSELVRALDAYEYLGETARTDKQLGASANADGVVSSIEKPSFAQLLGFAIEHGGISKKNDGTNLTLSTSLYSLYALGTKDTAENYARAGILNRVGVAATFELENKDNELANARRNNLTEWSAKVRLFGDRSTRSPGFQRKFATKVRPIILDRLRSLGRAIEQLARSNSAYTTLEDNALTTLPDEVRARMACPDYTAATVAQKEEIITAVILGRLRTIVYDPVHSGRVRLDPREITLIESEFLPNLKRSLDNLVLANKDVKEAIEDLQKGPLTTFAYTNHRVPTSSDYSDLKFLFEQEKGFMGPLKLSSNLGFSLYNRPDRSLNQDQVRDFSAALSFGGASDSPFTEAENRSKITYSFVGRYQRLFENRGIAGRTADIGTLQFVTEIPLFKGLSLPFSVTYSSATEEEKKQGFRFNFGTRFDMDKLVELLRASSKP